LKAKNLPINLLITTHAQYCRWLAFNIGYSDLGCLHCSLVCHILQF